MKFAHMSDCHLGSWSSHPDMRDYPGIAFDSALAKCIGERVDFIIIAGDLFDTSLPNIDTLKSAVSSLKKCRDAGVPVYAIPGSHDYSPTGKTMISVLEEAGLLADLCKFERLDDGKIRLAFTKDAKTGAKLTGLMGRKGGLDATLYKSLDRSIESEPGFKIFVFHAGIEEYRPASMKDVLAVPLEDLPKNFGYYATGHIHKQFFDEKNKIVFPGELFPTSFDELESYNGGFVIVAKSSDILSVDFVSSKVVDVTMMSFDVNGRTPASVEQEIAGRIEKDDIAGKILLLKLSGVIEGSVSEINFNALSEKARARGAKVIKRNTSGVSTKEFEEVKVDQNMSTEQIEKGLIERSANQLQLSGVTDVSSFVIGMMAALDIEKQEDETNTAFEERIRSGARKVAGL